MVDKAIILRKISELEIYQKQIREFSAIVILKKHLGDFDKFKEAVLAYLKASS